MGMKIGMYNAVKTSIPLKNKDGSSAGTITVMKYNRVKKKKLGYNFKKVSNRILAAKTSLFAGKAVREARTAVVGLLMKQMSGDYDSGELDSALEHARKMERVAKKRKRHMEEEERARQTGSCAVEEEIETAEGKEEEQKENEKVSRENEQKLDEMARELKRMIEESEQALNELAQELTDASWEDMDPKQLEKMKRRHRAQEMREIMEADLKYLKALFDRLSKEKQASESGSSNSSSWAGQDSVGGVSLELGGVDMPVETSEAPAAVEGANMDVTV
ncbi:MAG: hypothetical protein HFI51_14165 [Lachnospiraceae bacterium]|nr:hypothetical protein [Lachnospiraceae bacterium]